MLKYPALHMVVVTQMKDGQIQYRVRPKTVRLVIAYIHFTQTSKRKITFHRVEVFQPTSIRLEAQVLKHEVSIALAEATLRDYLEKS